MYLSYHCTGWTLSWPVDTTRGDVGTFTNQSVALRGLWTWISIRYILFIKNHNENGHLASIFYYLCQKAFLSSIYYSTCCLSERLSSDDSLNGRQFSPDVLLNWSLISTLHGMTVFTFKVLSQSSVFLWMALCLLIQFSISAFAVEQLGVCL